MRFLLMASVACSLALVGCGGGTKNSSATNNSSAANTSTAANSSAPAAGGGYRAAFLAQCEQRGRANPQVPAGFDFAGACGCAYDRALADKPNPEAFVTNPENGPAISEALAICVRERMGAAGAAPSAGAEEGEEAAEEGTEGK